MTQQDILAKTTCSIHKVSFQLVPQLSNHLAYCLKRLHVRDRVMTSHDACTSGTFWVLTVASLQRLKMESHIPAPADCEVRCLTKFLNAQSETLQKLRRAIQKSPDLAPNDFHLFLHLKKFLSGQRQRFQDDRRRWMSHIGSNLRRQTSTTLDTKVDLTVWEMPQSWRWMCWKIAQHLLRLVL